MQHLVEAVRLGVAQRNWYAALALALTLPDICVRLADPSVRRRDPYIAWCDRYLTPRYTRALGPDRQEHVFLHGADCYALRCALLHQGSDDVTDHDVRKALDSFTFVAPAVAGGIIYHRNQFNRMLQLQVDLFCSDMLEAVDEWSREVLVPGSEAAARTELLMRVKPAETFSF